MPKNNFPIAVGWVGFIKPNIGDGNDAAIEQPIELFIQPTDTITSNLEMTIHNP